jgi:hypothetical protein
MIGASFDSTKTPLQQLLDQVVAEAYDEEPEEWDSDKPCEEVS